MKFGVVAGMLVLFAVVGCGGEERNFGAAGGAGSAGQGGDGSVSEGGSSAGVPPETVGGTGSAGEPPELVGGGGGGGPIEPPLDGPGLGQLGEPCSEEGALACEGHAQAEQLLCEEGFWQSNGSCPAAEHCDTREGATQGLCRPILAECEGQPEGTLVCRGNNVERCDADQVSASLEMACTFCDAGSCSCPAGTYGVDGTFAECLGCESGSFTAEANLEECALWSDCEAGSRVSNTPSASEDRTCADCPAGKFTSGPNQSECLDANACPAGTIQTAPGTPSTPPTCSDCEAGTYCAGGTAAAVPCAAGTWDHDGSPATTCASKTTCSAGQYISSAGSATTDRTCSSCAAGKYSSGTNASSCSTCATCSAGTYASTACSATTNRVCTACAAGSYSTGTNANSCSTCATCSAGTEVATDCSPTTNRTCTSCAPGKYSTGTNVDSCSACATCSAGTEVATDCSATTNRTCTACAAGSYSTGTNANSCSTCATCAAGTYASTACSATTNRACTACAAGKYSTSTNATSCTNCTAACTAAAGTYQSTACTATTNRVCTAFPSCQGLAASCGDSANDGCCKSPTVTGTAAGAPFYRGTTTTYPATIATFALDKYEVTVGRFRKFVEANVARPAPGAGAHPLIANSGWQTDWNGSIAGNSGMLATAVQCEASRQTWHTDGTTDRLPINCVSWFEAFAFCAWDGGRLPTETEWEYAAAGGSNEREYPWGNTPPVWDQVSTEANFDCWGDGNKQTCTFADILPVGSKPAGVGWYGQLDLAGSMWEWTLDWWSEYTIACSNCANIASGENRMKRGGAWSYDSSYLKTWYRNTPDPPTSHYHNNGFRCARTP